MIPKGSFCLRKVSCFRLFCFFILLEVQNKHHYISLLLPLPLFDITPCSLAYSPHLLYHFSTLSGLVPYITSHIPSILQTTGHFSSPHKFRPQQLIRLKEEGRRPFFFCLSVCLASRYPPSLSKCPAFTFQIMVCCLFNSTDLVHLSWLCRHYIIRHLL